MDYKPGFTIDSFYKPLDSDPRERFIVQAQRAPAPPDLTVRKPSKTTPVNRKKLVRKHGGVIETIPISPKRVKAISPAPARKTATLISEKSALIKQRRKKATHESHSPDIDKINLLANLLMERSLYPPKPQKAKVMEPPLPPKSAAPDRQSSNKENYNSIQTYMKQKKKDQSVKLKLQAHNAALEKKRVEQELAKIQMIRKQQREEQNQKIAKSIQKKLEFENPLLPHKSLMPYDTSKVPAQKPPVNHTPSGEAMTFVVDPVILVTVDKNTEPAFTATNAAAASSQESPANKLNLSFDKDLEPKPEVLELNAQESTEKSLKLQEILANARALKEKLVLQVQQKKELNAIEQERARERQAMLEQEAQKKVDDEISQFVQSLKTDLAKKIGSKDKLKPELLVDTETTLKHDSTEPVIASDLKDLDASKPILSETPGELISILDKSFPETIIKTENSVSLTATVSENEIGMSFGAYTKLIEDEKRQAAAANKIKAFMMRHCRRKRAKDKQPQMMHIPEDFYLDHPAKVDKLSFANMYSRHFGTPSANELRPEEQQNKNNPLNHTEKGISIAGIEKVPQKIVECLPPNPRATEEQQNKINRLNHTEKGITIDNTENVPQKNVECYSSNPRDTEAEVNHISSKKDETLKPAESDNFEPKSKTNLEFENVIFDGKVNLSERPIVEKDVADISTKLESDYTQDFVSFSEVSGESSISEPALESAHSASDNFYSFDDRNGELSSPPSEKLPLTKSLKLPMKDFKQPTQEGPKKMSPVAKNEGHVDEILSERQKMMGPRRLTPQSLSRKLEMELQLLHAIQETQIQVVELERNQNNAKHETTLLLQTLLEKQKRHDVELQTARQKATRLKSAVPEYKEYEDSFEDSPNISSTRSDMDEISEHIHTVGDTQNLKGQLSLADINRPERNQIAKKDKISLALENRFQQETDEAQNLADFSKKLKIMRLNTQPPKIEKSNSTSLESSIVEEDYEEKLSIQSTDSLEKINVIIQKLSEVKSSDLNRLTEKQSRLEQSRKLIQVLQAKKSSVDKIDAKLKKEQDRISRKLELFLKPVNRPKIETKLADQLAQQINIVEQIEDLDKSFSSIRDQTYKNNDIPTNNKEADYYSEEFEDLEIPESISADISEPISGKMSLSDPVKASSTIPPRVMEIDDYSFLKEEEMVLSRIRSLQLSVEQKEREINERKRIEHESRLKQLLKMEDDLQKRVTNLDIVSSKLAEEKLMVPKAEVAQKIDENVNIPRDQTIPNTEEDNQKNCTPDTFKLSAASLENAQILFDAQIPDPVHDTESRSSPIYSDRFSSPELSERVADETLKLNIVPPVAQNNLNQEKPEKPSKYALEEVSNDIISSAILDVSKILFNFPEALKLISKAEKTLPKKVEECFDKQYPASSLDNGPNSPESTQNTAANEISAGTPQSPTKKSKRQIQLSLNVKLGCPADEMQAVIPAKKDASLNVKTLDEKLEIAKKALSLHIDATFTAGNCIIPALDSLGQEVSSEIFAMLLDLCNEYLADFYQQRYATSISKSAILEMLFRYIEKCTLYTASHGRNMTDYTAQIFAATEKTWKYRENLEMEIKETIVQSICADVVQDVTKIVIDIEK